MLNKYQAQWLHNRSMQRILAICKQSKKNEFKRYFLTGLSSKGFILLQQNYKIILVKVMKSFDVKNNCS